jgi:hypothetical protein
VKLAGAGRGDACTALPLLLMGDTVTRDFDNDGPSFGKPDSELGSCPHCGCELSPWQQVLLRVDKALVCKQCWYKIILDAPEDAEEERSPSQSN